MFDASGVGLYWVGWTWLTVGWIAAVAFGGLVFAAIAVAVRAQGRAEKKQFEHVGRAA